MTDIPTDEAALAALVVNRSDQEIYELAGQVGVGTALDTIFEAMTERFDPAAAAGQALTVQWNITDPDATHPYHLAIDGGACTAARGRAEGPRLTIGLALPDFLRFVVGELNGMTAFMSGKLTVTGDIGLAQSMERWFVRA